MKRVLWIMYALIASLFVWREVVPAESWLLPLGLCVAPLALSAVLRARVSSTGLLVLACLIAIPVFARPSGTAASLTATLLVQLAAYLVVQSDRRAQAALLALGPTYAALEMARSPAASLAIVFLAALACALAGANLLTTRWGTTRGEYRQSESGAAYAVVYGAVAALLIVCSLPFLSLPLLVLPEPTLSSGARTDDDRDPRVGLDGRNDAGSTAGVATRGELGGRFPGSINLTGQVTRLRHELVARITARPVGGGPPQWVGPLYLRGLVLDRIEGRRVSASENAGRWINDADDGKVDGLVYLDANRHGLTEPRFELSVVQQALRTSGPVRAILFTPQPLLAIDRPEVWHDADGVLLIEDVDDTDWVEYSVVVGGLDPLPDALPLETDDPRWLQLPNDPVVARLAQEARELTANATTTLEQVERVLDEYRSFEYELQATTVPGVKGLPDFLERRRGYCSYFAVASTIQLRSLGIPTRLATGFLGGDYDTETNVYSVDSRDGHAWIEVGIEGAGWIPFDPTPTAARETAIANRAGRLRDGFLAWGDTLLHDVGRWFANGDRGSLADVGATLARIPMSAFSVVLLVALFALCYAAFWLLRRVLRGPSSRRSQGTTEAVDTSPSGFLEQLFAALARRGITPSPGETPRRFVRRATNFPSAGGADISWSSVSWIVELAYRERFGWQPALNDELVRALSTVQAIDSAGSGE